MNMVDYDTLITQQLPEHLHQIAKDYAIPEKYLRDEPSLIILVLESKSLHQTEEKQNWFDLMDIMSPEQVNKLRDILTREKKKIAEIEEKYEEKKKEIKQKYQSRFDMYTHNARIKEIKATERNQRSQEIEDADSLLDNL